jgi:hypothetical protein
MDEIFAKVDGVFARLVNRPDGSAGADRYDPAARRFVRDMDYFMMLKAPEHEGVDSFIRYTEAEFYAEIKKLE